MHTCTRAHMHTHMYMHMHMHTHTHAHKQTHKRTHTRAHTRAHTHTHTHTHAACAQAGPAAAHASVRSQEPPTVHRRVRCKLMMHLHHFCRISEFLAMRTSYGWWPRGMVARGQGMQAQGSRAAAHSCPRNHGGIAGVCKYRCCACLTPSHQKEAGEHSGVCASAKVKRWHGEATFVPCKHDLASMKLCHAA